MLILVVLSQNVWHPYPQHLDLIHRLQMSGDCCMIATHLTGQFSSCLMGICIEVRWPPRVQSVTHVIIALLETHKSFLGSISAIEYSP
jgi:hypothetical protein